MRAFGGDGRDPRLYGDDDTVRDVLAQSRLWFVVGLSDNRMRAAYGVAQDLQSKGCHVVPVHPRACRTLGEAGYPNLAAAAAVHGPPDVVDVFVRSDLAGHVADEALAVAAGAVWFQLGVVDEDAARRVRAAGVRMVMDRCPTVEWPLLGPAA